MEWIADKRGKGGILRVEPEEDAGTYDDDMYDVGTLLSEIAPVHNI
jgi:hypothetical protein